MEWFKIISSASNTEYHLGPSVMIDISVIWFSVILRHVTMKVSLEALNDSHDKYIYDERSSFCIFCWNNNYIFSSDLNFTPT